MGDNMQELEETLNHVKWCEYEIKRAEEDLMIAKARLLKHQQNAEKARVNLEAVKQKHLDWINAHNQGKL